MQLNKLKISVIRKMKNEKTKNEFMKTTLIPSSLLYRYKKRNKNVIGMIKINLIIDLFFLRIQRYFSLECILNPRSQIFYLKGR